MTKKIFRISSMTLGLALLLLGNGMNHAKASYFQIQWPENNEYNNNKYVAYFLPTSSQTDKVEIASGITEAGHVSSHNVTEGTKLWSSYPQGEIYIQLTENLGSGAQYFTLPMTSWTSTGKNSINDVLNETVLTLNSNGTFTIAYPN